MTGANMTTPPVRPRVAPQSFPVMRWLAMHGMAIAFFGSLVGAVLAYAAWMLVPAKSESYALLQVASSPNYVANNDPQRAKTDFTTYLKTQALLIKSDNVLKRALNDESFGVSKLDGVKDAREPLVYLDEQVLVTFQEGNEVIRISCKMENADDAKKIVDAVQIAYMKEIIEKEILTKNELLGKVKLAKIDLTDTIKRKGGVVEVANTGVAPPLPLPGAIVSGGVAGNIPPTITVPGAAGPDVKQAGAVSPAIGDSLRRTMADQFVKKIAEYEEQLVYLPSVIKDRQAERDRIQKAIKSALTDPAKEESLALAEKDPEIAVLRYEAKRARADYSHYKSLATNPNAASVVAFKERAEALDAQADQLRNSKAKELETSRRLATGNQFDQQLAVAEREIAKVQEQLQVAAILRDRAKEELNKLPPELLREDTKGGIIDPSKTDIVAHNVLLDKVTQQEIALQFELSSPPRVTLRQAASTAVLRDMKKQVLASIFAALLGIALAGLVAVSYEAKTRKLSALSELTTTSTCPCVAAIPHAPTVSSFNDPLKRADITEAVDKLRTFVTQTWLPRGAKSIAITSPFGDEGKATLACGLAESLARAGVRTLLVDFDLRSPAVHRVERLDNKRGVCELLRGEIQPADAVVGMPGGLYILPAGNWTDETRHFAAGDRVKSLLDVLTEPFECVVVHAHSLLTTAESVEVARRTDALLLCAQYRESRLPLIARASERLASMGLANTGLVYIGASTQEVLR